MLHNVIAAGEFGEAALEWIEAASLVIEIVAVAIIVLAIFYALGQALLRAFRGDRDDWRHQLQVSLGRSLLVALEVLVAADVVRTVALEFTFANVAVLGLLVLIRTFLGWALLVEMEGRWPWQVRAAAQDRTHSLEAQPTKQH